MSMYEQSDHLGKDEAERLLERRELGAFRAVLDDQIRCTSGFPGRVFTEWVDI